MVNGCRETGYTCMPAVEVRSEKNTNNGLNFGKNTIVHGFQPETENFDFGRK